MKQKKQPKNEPPPLTGTIIHYKTKGLYGREQQIRDSYLIGKHLGSGGFASCFEGTRKRDGKVFAIKVIDKNSNSMKKEGALNRLKIQIEIMKNYPHKHIVALFDNFEDSNYYYFVMEYCEKISLQKMYKQRKKLTEPEAKYFIKQLMITLDFLHSNKIIHRDIKNCNIMMDKNLNIKLGDFGLATYQNDKSRHRNCLCGTPNFMAPEIIQKKHYSTPVDLWSSGVVTFSLLYGEFPFNSKQSKQIQQKIVKMSYEFPAQPQISEIAKHFITSLLTFNPEKRMNPKQALQHQFLKIDVPLQLPQWVFLKKPTPVEMQQILHPQLQNRRIYKIASARQQVQTMISAAENQRQIKISSEEQCRSKSSKKEKNSKNKKETQANEVQKLQKTQKKKPRKQTKKKKYEKILNECLNNQSIESEKTKETPIVHNCIKEKEAAKKNNESLEEIKISQYPLKNDQGRGEMKQLQVKVQLIKELKKEEEGSFLEGISVKQKNENTHNLSSVCGQSHYQWLLSRLGSAIFIYQFRDKTHKYGFCFHLSNSVKLILFNDRTQMAILESLPEKILYKENNKSKAENLFSLNEIKGNMTLLKKFQMLQVFIKQATPSPHQNLKEFINSQLQTQLYKSVTTIQYWCRYIDEQKTSNTSKKGPFFTYLFSTPALIQVVFCSINRNVYIKKELVNEQIDLIVSNGLSQKQAMKLPDEKCQIKKVLGRNFNVVIKLVEHLLQIKKRKYQFHHRKQEKLQFEQKFIDYCRIKNKQE